MYEKKIIQFVSGTDPGGGNAPGAGLCPGDGVHPGDPGSHRGFDPDGSSQGGTDPGTYRGSYGSPGGGAYPAGCGGTVHRAPGSGLCRACPGRGRGGGAGHDRRAAGCGGYVRKLPGRAGSGVLRF